MDRLNDIGRREPPKSTAPRSELALAAPNADSNVV